MILNETLRNIINEAANSIDATIVKDSKFVRSVIHNYRTDDVQKKLRDTIFETLEIPIKERKKILNLIKSSGIEGAKNFKQFVNIYNKKIYNTDLLPFISGFLSLVPSAKGFGKGELFCAFLNKNVIINGGAGSFDLILNGDEAEVKEVKIKGKEKHILYNFKFGTENASKEAKIINMAKRYIKQYLYEIPEDEWPANAEDKLAKGELNALMSLVKKYEKKLHNTPTIIDVVIDSKGDVFLDKNIIGNVYDPTFSKKIKTILDQQPKLSFNDIVDAVRETYSKSNRSYIFIIGQQTTMKNLGMMCYKENLGKDIIPLDFTQNKLKIGVICNDFK